MRIAPAALGLVLTLGSTPALAIGFGSPAPVSASEARATGANAGIEVALDRSGHGIAVWTSTDAASGHGADADVVFATSDDGGRSWSAPRVIAPYELTDAADDRAAHVATDGHGTWIVVWESNAAAGGSAGPNHHIAYVRSDTAGMKWSAPASMDGGNSWTTATPMFPPGSGGAELEPRLATDAQGAWIASFTDLDPSTGATSAVRAESDDNGRSWEGPLHFSTWAHEQRAMVATDGQGAWIAAWDAAGAIGGRPPSELQVFFARSIAPSASAGGAATNTATAAPPSGPNASASDPSILDDGNCECTSTARTGRSDVIAGALAMCLVIRRRRTRGPARPR